MVVLTSLYSVADRLFLSNFAGKAAFAAVGFITPYLMMFNSVGFLFGTGGSALIAKLLGAKQEAEANEAFSTLILASACTGMLLSMIGQLCLKPVELLQGAQGALLENSLLYGRIYLLGTPACLAQFEFQALYQTSGKGRLGLKAALLAGLINIGLDGLLLAYAGSDGIAAYSIMTYVSFLFTAVFGGYISGVAPIISFHYGAEHHEELHSLLKKSIVLIVSCSCAMFVLSELLAGPIAASYAARDPDLMRISVHGFRLFAVNFLFAELSIFFFSFFKALNNGLISAILSLCREFAFQIPAVLLLPLLWKLDGIWLSVGVAELMTVLLEGCCPLRNRSRYRY